MEATCNGSGGLRLSYLERGTHNFLEFKFQPQGAWGYPSNKSRNKYFLRW